MRGRQQDNRHLKLGAEGVHGSGWIKAAGDRPWSLWWSWSARMQKVMTLVYVFTCFVSCIVRNGKYNHHSNKWSDEILYNFTLLAICILLSVSKSHVFTFCLFMSSYIICSWNVSLCASNHSSYQQSCGTEIWAPYICSLCGPRHPLSRLYKYSN